MQYSPMQSFDVNESKQEWQFAQCFSQHLNLFLCIFKHLKTKQNKTKINTNQFGKFPADIDPWAVGLNCLNRFYGHLSIKQTQLNCGGFKARANIISESCATATVCHHDWGGSRGPRCTPRPAPRLHIKRPRRGCGATAGTQQRGEINIVLHHSAPWRGPCARPYSWGGIAMPVGQLTPEVAHNRSKNPIDSSSRGQQPATDPSELHNGSLLDTWGIMSPEILRSTEETAGSEKKIKKLHEKWCFFLGTLFQEPLTCSWWTIRSTKVSFRVEGFDLDEIKDSGCPRHTTQSLTDHM